MPSNIARVRSDNASNKCLAFNIFTTTRRLARIGSKFERRDKLYLTPRQEKRNNSNKRQTLVHVSSEDTDDEKGRMHMFFDTLSRCFYLKTDVGSPEPSDFSLPSIAQDILSRREEFEHRYRLVTAHNKFASQVTELSQQDRVGSGIKRKSGNSRNGRTMSLSEEQSALMEARDQLRDIVNQGKRKPRLILDALTTNPTALEKPLLSHDSGDASGGNVTPDVDLASSLSQNAVDNHIEDSRVSFAKLSPHTFQRTPIGSGALSGEFVNSTNSVDRKNTDGLLQKNPHAKLDPYGSGSLNTKRLLATNKLAVTDERSLTVGHVRHVIHRNKPLWPSLGDIERLTAIKNYKIQQQKEQKELLLIAHSARSKPIPDVKEPDSARLRYTTHERAERVDTAIPQIIVPSHTNVDCPYCQMHYTATDGTTCPPNTPVTTLHLRKSGAKKLTAKTTQISRTNSNNPQKIKEPSPDGENDASECNDVRNNGVIKVKFSDQNYSERNKPTQKKVLSKDIEIPLLPAESQKSIQEGNALQNPGRIPHKLAYTKVSATSR